MMHEIKSFKIFQTAKVIAVLYTVLGFVEGAIVLIASLRHPNRVPIFFSFGLPVLFGVVGFIFMVIICWLYNLIAARIGGIAFELTPRGGD
jgi:hypothetical protein